MGIEFFKHLSPDRLLFGKQYAPDGKEQHRIEHWRSLDLWDPTGYIDYQEAVKQSSLLQWRSENIPLHAARIRTIRTASIMVAVLVGVIMLRFPIHILLPLLFALPAIIIAFTLQGIRQDLINYLIANEEGWLYHPSTDYRKGNSLTKSFPELFRPGNRRYAEDQTWGVHEHKGRSIPFHTGLYHYFVKEGKSEKHHINQYFTFKLKKHLDTTFKLYPETVFSRLANTFGNKEINVESIAFNKMFAFQYDGTKGERAASIVQTLSPVVQEQLVTLSRKRKGTTVLFTGNQVFFLFDQKRSTHKKSKVFPRIMIDQEDIKESKRDLDELITISKEIGQHLS